MRPGVYNASGFAFLFLDGRRFQTIDLLNPQVTVAGDTQFTIDTDTAQQVTVSRPNP